MKLSTMKLNKGERLVTTKFAQTTRKLEYNFGAVIELKDGKSLLSTTTARYKIEAMKHFEDIARSNGGTVNIKTVRVLD